MTIMTFRTQRVRPAVLAFLSAAAMLVGRLEAQTAPPVSGTAFGSYVNALGTTLRSPVATLPSTGGYSLGETQSFGVPNAVDASWLTATTTGATESGKSTSQSVSELENVSILNGLITADNVTAIASSFVSSAGAGSDADGSGFVNLVVAGVPVTTDVEPNTRVDLPGVGYAILNEQVASGNGVTSSGLTVNMIRVVLTSLLGTPTGQIVVGSAKSGVGL